jgi:hypothetical protein
MNTKMIKIGIAAMLLAGAFVMPVKASSNNVEGLNVQMKMNPNMKKGTKMTHAMFHVSGLCDLCKARIEKAAKSVKGVESAVWDEKTKMLHLMYNPTQTTPVKVQQAIAGVGHDAGKVKATNAAYKSLPSCCQYPRK